VALRWQQDGLSLTVQDRYAAGLAAAKASGGQNAEGPGADADGHGAPGWSPDGAGSGGYGLTGMRERAELLGGELVAGGTADGFQVRLWLPA
jgi:hypothetical protein